MPVRSHSTGWSTFAAIPWRVLNQRFSFIFFMTIACGLLILGRVQPQLVENPRPHIIDGLTPVLDAAAWPMTTAENVLARVQSYMSLQAENQRLREGNAQLTQWQNALVALQNENRELRGLLHFKDEPGLA